MYTNTCEDTINVPQHDKTTRANDTGNLWKLVPSPMAYHQSLLGASICIFACIWAYFFRAEVEKIVKNKNYYSKSPLLDVEGFAKQGIKKYSPYR
jgi:hypothetical protein